jgi:LysM repeat protein
LGRHSRKTRIQIATRRTIAAAPLAGVAATFCLSPQAASASTVANPTTHHAAVVPAASQPGDSPARLLSVTRQVREQKPALPASYTVRSGDSLSAIAGRVYHNSDAWPVIFWANRGQIRWANIIETGQVLRVPAEPGKIPAAPTELAPAPPAAPVESAPVQQAPAQEAPTQSAPSEAAPTQSSGSQASSSYSGGGYPGGSFGQCVVARESGGNSQVMNSSGHYGLYQFSSSTWAAYGGNPADFGNASVAEQNQVFANAIAQGGQSNWSAYDGC